MTNKEIILPLMGPTISLLVTRPLSFNKNTLSFWVYKPQAIPRSFIIFA